MSPRVRLNGQDLGLSGARRGGWNSAAPCFQGQRSGNRSGELVAQPPDRRCGTATREAPDPQQHRALQSEHSLVALGLLGPVRWVTCREVR